MTTQHLPDSLPAWLEDAFGDPMAPPEPWQKALTVATPIVPVYARWLTNMTMMCGEVVAANQWAVWWTDREQPLFEEVSRDDFDKRFVLESAAPASLQGMYDAMLSYEDWVAKVDAEYLAAQGKGEKQ